MPRDVRNTRPTWADSAPAPLGWCNPCLTRILGRQRKQNGSGLEHPGRAIVLVAQLQTVPNPVSGNLIQSVQMIPCCADCLGVQDGSSPIVQARGNLPL